MKFTYSEFIFVPLKINYRAIYFDDVNLLILKVKITIYNLRNRDRIVSILVFLLLLLQKLTDILCLQIAIFFGDFAKQISKFLGNLKNTFGK